jgi:hypothetical protein
MTIYVYSTAQQTAPQPQRPHDDLRRSPIYQRALGAPDTMGRSPANNWMRRNENRDNRRVEEASLKLDHLIRNALDVNYYDYGIEYLTEWVVCAIKAFVRHLDQTLPLMKVDRQHHAMIDPRIAFCWRIAAASDRERRTRIYVHTSPLDNNQPLSADWFEHLVRHFGSSMHEVVYHNPFWTLYAGPGTYVGDCLDRRLNDFHTRMKSFWY